MNILNLPSGSDNSLLLEGAGISYNSQTGTISNSGVRSITGTSNQVLTSGSTGELTLSLPQNIGTTSTVQFGGLKFNNGAIDVNTLIMNGGAGTMTNTINGIYNNNLASGVAVDFKNASNASVFKIQENGGMEVSQPMKFMDSVKINLGNSSDFQLWHDGSTINTILTGAGRDLVFKSETTSAFNYKFQDHNNVDLFKITGAGVLHVPSFSTGNRVITTTGSAGELTASLAYATAADANSIVQRNGTGDITAATVTATTKVSASNTISNEAPCFVTASHASFVDVVNKLETVRAGSSAFYYLQAWSQNDSDPKFRVRGDGVISADSGTITSPADIAEYFESTDATALTVGRTVVLDGGKVRYYNAGTDTTDQIIGVVRPKGSGNGVMLTGNAYEARWNQKYQTDDYDAVILKSDGSGEWALNPAYDPNEEYIPREQRNEWNLIGLLGQIRITNGQTMNPRWVLMSSGSVASKYLVR